MMIDNRWDIKSVTMSDDKLIKFRADIESFLRRAQRYAFFMATHPRLGGESPAASLPNVALEAIVKYI